MQLRCCSIAIIGFKEIWSSDETEGRKIANAAIQMIMVFARFNNGEGLKHLNRKVSHSDRCW